MKADAGPPEVTSGDPPQTQTTSPVRTQRRGSLLSGLIGLSLVLLAIGAVVVADASDKPALLRPVGRDAPVNVSARTPGDISAHNSPTLVRNPAHPSNLAVSSRIDTPVFDCALHVSLDSGAHWTQTPIRAPTGVRDKCYAPDVAFSRDGTLYLSFVTLHGPGNVPHSLWVSTSTDGGRTLSKPVRVRGPLTFQVRLAADPVKPDRVYLTWLQAAEVGVLKFANTANPILASRSDDRGATWSPPKRVSSPARARVITPVPVVGADGTLYVLYQDVGNDRLDYEAGHNGRGGAPYPGRYALVLARSRDHGTTWQESLVDDRLKSMSRYIVFLAPAPTLAVDRNGRVYAAFQDTRLGDPDVMLWTLAPGSSTWTGPKRVNDTPVHDATAQYLPKLAVAPDGRLDVLYYDRRQDRNNLQNQVSLQSSFDHGESFTPAIRLTSHTSDSRIGFGAKEGLPDLGSRLALLSSDHATLALWTDTRAGTPATQKQDLAEAAVAVTEPAGLSDSTRTALQYGAIIAAIAGLLLLALTIRQRPDAPPDAQPTP